MTIDAGVRLLHYRIVEKLGEGGNGMWIAYAAGGTVTMEAETRETMNLMRPKGAAHGP